MFTREFALDAATRAIKTMAQSIIAVLVVGVPIWDIDWASGIGIALTAGVLSLLTSLADPTVDGRGTTGGEYVGAHRRDL